MRQYCRASRGDFATIGAGSVVIRKVPPKRRNGVLHAQFYEDEEEMAIPLIQKY